MLKNKKNDKNIIVKVDRLNKRYKKAKTLALKDVSFYVEKGAFFALLGPNGAGKTTIVSILTTLLSKTSGSVSIDGLSIDKNSSEIRQRIGVIFQKPSLDLNLTAEENVRFHSNLYGLYAYRPTFSLMPQQYQAKVKKLSKLLGIQKEIHQPVKTLSGGMKRKLEIIRSLMHDPKVLFLDEPTTGLDPISRSNLWEYLQEIREKQKTTIFLTTHYLEEAEDADYIGIINKGKMVAKGTPREIKNVLIEKYLILDAKNRKRLEDELKSHKIKYSGKGPLQVSLDRLSAQKVIQKIKTPLSVLDVHSPTLEEAYVKIIGDHLI